MFNELLVLGLVPGTNIQITFNDYATVLCVAVLAIVWHRNPRLFRYAVAKLEFWMTIFSLRFKQPAGLIARTG